MLFSAFPMNGILTIEAHIRGFDESCLIWKAAIQIGEKILKISDNSHFDVIYLQALKLPIKSS
ncbi:hypothetical protein DKW60_23445 [Leucothrix pacifica]|uniref:Uncharacterized protein n=1 Tax=Leucothrix pacifica TaxID=1247513 RepID=A0A317C0W7_9GAMM|nr:hypothetical protein DKW60_23445 [Leucothrix pacifica]